MGLRIRKRTTILPGLWLNFSKSGVSLSAGGKGLTANIGKKGIRTTMGALGTGVSYSSYEPYAKKDDDAEAQEKKRNLLPLLLCFIAGVCVTAIMVGLWM